MNFLESRHVKLPQDLGPSLHSKGCLSYVEHDFFGVRVRRLFVRLIANVTHHRPNV